MKTHTYVLKGINELRQNIDRTEFASDTNKLSEIANELSKVCKAKRYFAKMYQNLNLYF